MKKRIAYYDILRGIAIIAVIAIHSDGIGYTYNGIPFDITVVWRQLMNFAVPLFMCVSGFFLADKKIESFKDYTSFIKKQVPRVMVPYLIWSIVYLGLLWSNGHSVKDLIIRLVTFRTSTPFYFILLIIEFYFLLPLLQRLANKKGFILSTVISILGCLAVFFIKNFTALPLPLFLEYTAVTMLVFFVLGMYIRKGHGLPTNRVLVMATMAGIVLSVVESYWQYEMFGDIMEAVGAVKLGAFAYSIPLLMLMLKNEKKWDNALAYIGEISFGIFLSHMLFMGYIRDILKVDDVLLAQVVLIVVTLMVCTVFAYLTRKLNKKLAVKYLGQ